MNMRVLFAIHGPADERTAVYRAVRHRVDVEVRGVNVRELFPRDGRGDAGVR